MSVLNDIFEAIENIGEGILEIGGFLIDVATFPFKTLAEAIAYVTDKVGDGVEAAFDELGLDIVGDALDFVIDRAGEKIQGIITRSADYLEKLPGRIERAADDLFDDDLWNNFGSWFAKNLVNAAELSGVFEELEELADLVKFNTRGLTSREKALAESVFGHSINLDLVRIDEYSLSNLVNGQRPFVTFNTINTWGKIDDATLIHELTHVWQYAEYGAMYIPEAISAQNSDEGYDFGGEAALEAAKAAGKGLSSFNFEQQAEIVKEYFQLKNESKDEVGSAGDDVIHGSRMDLYAHFVQEVSTFTAEALIAIARTDDKLAGGLGDDTLYGYSGKDVLLGGAGDDILDGGIGDDRLEGDRGDDILFGNHGNDTLKGGDGNDMLAGGDGHDHLIDTAGNDTFYGNAGNDILQSGSGNDLLYGGLGNDRLDGGSGNDRMYGGAGDDTYVVDSSNDEVNESASKGTDTVISTVNYTLGDHLENLTLHGNAVLSGTGNSQDNRIKGNSGDNTLKGLAGRDVLDGDAGNDAIDGGSGDDIVRGGTGDDTLDGGAGNDLLHGNEGDDLIRGGSGRDTLTGGDGDDRLYAESNFLPIAPPLVPITPGLFNLNVGQIEIINRLPTLLLPTLPLPTFPVPPNMPPNIPNNPPAPSPGDKLDGGNGDDVLTGASNDDLLLGGSGHDVLKGGAGNDILVGFGGNAWEEDTLTGGSGADTFVLGQMAGDFGYIPGVTTFYKKTSGFATRDGHAKIQDFNRLEGDKLHVYGQSSNYRLSYQSISGDAAIDTVIRYADTDDLLAVVEDATVSVARDMVFV